jgi:hypothetical protein
VYPTVRFWRFEVTYTFLIDTSSSALNFQINQPPMNGSCSIQPNNGTTTTVFHVSCIDWVDQDEIGDYALYLRSHDGTRAASLIAFSGVSDFDVRLSAAATSNSSSVLDLFVVIRDTLDCTQQFNLTSVHVWVDESSVDALLDALQRSPVDMNKDPLVQLLSRANQNLVSQLITSIADRFSQIDRDNIAAALSGPRVTCDGTTLTSSRLCRCRWCVCCQYLPLIIGCDTHIHTHTLDIRQSVGATTVRKQQQSPGCCS